MDIPLNAKVKCSDGTEARSVCIIINPIDKAVTHLVIETKGLLGTEYMVPIEHISSSTAHQIELRCTHEELIQMDPFTRSQFIGPEDSAYSTYQQTELDLEADEGYLWPYAVYDDAGMYINTEQIPSDELAIHRGALVKATDGNIGHVGEFIINPENNHITHLVLREGHIWDEKEVTIALADIQRIEDDVVYLKLDKNALKELPSVSVRRWGK